MSAKSGYQPKIELIKNPRNPLLKNKFGFRTLYNIPEGTPGFLGKAGERSVFNTKADALRFIKEDLPKIIAPVRADETKIAQIKKLFEEGKTNQQVATALKTNVTTVKRIKKDLGLDVVKKTQLDTIKQKFLKLKNLAEETNKGFKYVQMKDLLEQVGLRGSYSPSDVKNFKKYNIPKLESAQDKVRKAFKFLTSDPNKPVEELFSFNSKIAELTGTNQSQVSMILKDTPEYIEFKPIMSKLIIPSSRARLTGKGMVLADLIEEVENVKPTGSGGVPRGARSTPEYFIMDNAIKHVNQGGTKVEFTRMPGTLDETGKLISTTDAEFIYKGKKYTYDDLLKAGRTNFPEVYKAFDDMDELLNRSVIHPVTKQKINFSTLMKEAYNKGAGYSYDRSPFAIDHFKQVKEEPFTNLRVISARLNSAAGVLKQKEFQALQGAFGEEKTKLYQPDKVERYIKKIGYNFPKDMDKLFADEVKLAEDILVPTDRYPEGRKLKTPSEGVIPQQFLKGIKDNLLSKATKNEDNVCELVFGFGKATGGVAGGGCAKQMELEFDKAPEQTLNQISQTNSPKLKTFAQRALSLFPKLGTPGKIAAGVAAGVGTIGALTYNRELGEFVNPLNDDKAGQGTLTEWIKENPVKTVAGTSIGFSAQEIPGAYKKARELGRGRTRSALGITGALKPVLTTFGTPAMTALFEVPFSAKRLEEGETMTEVLTDPLGPALGLTFMEPLSRRAGVIRGGAAPGIMSGIKRAFNPFDLADVGKARPGLTSKILRMGMSPRVIAAISRLGPYGMLAGAGLGALSQYQKYQNEEGMIYNFFNRDE